MEQDELARSGDGLASVMARMRADDLRTPLTFREPFHRLPLTAEPAAFQQVKQVHALALGMPRGTGRALTLGVCNPSGQVAALCQLFGQEQAMRFAHGMERLGYQGRLFESRVGSERCDVVFQRTDRL